MGKKAQETASKLRERKHKDLMEMYVAGMAIFNDLIETTKEMHTANLQAQKDLVTQLGSIAGKVEPENYKVLMSTLETCTLAVIESQRAIGMEATANGRAGIKMLESLGVKALDTATEHSNAQSLKWKAEKAKWDVELAECEKHTAELTAKYLSAEKATGYKRAKSYAKASKDNGTSKEEEKLLSKLKETYTKDSDYS